MPISVFHKDIRDEMTRSDFYQAVAMLESTVTQAKTIGQTSFHSPFPVEMYAQLEVWQGYQTIKMWLEVPISSVASVLDQVRSRALTFALEIEAENPQAGEPRREEGRGAEPPVPLARTDAIFNTVIFGGTAAVGPNASVEMAVVPGDLGSLLHYLEIQGVLEQDRTELVQAIRSDTAEAHPKGRPGKSVAAWLGNVSLRVAASGSRVGESAVGGLIASAVARYLGLT